MPFSAPAELDDIGCTQLMKPEKNLVNTTIIPSVIEKHTLPDFFYKPFSVSHYYRTVTAGNSVFLYNRTVRRGVLDWTVAVARLLCDVDHAMLCDTTQRAYRRDTLSLTASCVDRP